VFFISCPIKTDSLCFLSDWYCESPTKIFLDSGMFILSVTTVRGFIKFISNIHSTFLVVGNSQLKHFISLRLRFVLLRFLSFKLLGVCIIENQMVSGLNLLHLSNGQVTCLVMRSNIVWFPFWSSGMFYKNNVHGEGCYIWRSWWDQKWEKKKSDLSFEM
jgi:hypothetical protein